jgi:hypothetical protein
MEIEHVGGRNKKYIQKYGGETFRNRFLEVPVESSVIK